MTTGQTQTYRLRSYVIRGRRTKAQQDAYQAMWSRIGLSPTEDICDFTALFGRKAPTILEIGFGGGQSLLEVATLQSQHNFIGIETHAPGIGLLCQGIQQRKLNNIRIFHHDAVEILNKNIANHSLAGVQIFFPDPWPKRRHHGRRLIQPAFVELVISKLIPQGFLHLATDWEDYAKHMLTVVSHQPKLQLLSTHRSSQRPLVTKFEKRALTAGRDIWDFQLILIDK